MLAVTISGAVLLLVLIALLVAGAAYAMYKTVKS